MWAAVRQLTGRQSQHIIPDGVNADCLNKHYADISTDRAYLPPPTKLTAIPDWARDWITENRMFTMRLVSALVLSRLDYCNAVLTGLPASTLAPLRRVLHAAARVVLELRPRAVSYTHLTLPTNREV